jgi:hypothetical protein
MLISRKKSQSIARSTSSHPPSLTVIGPRMEQRRCSIGAFLATKISGRESVSICLSRLHLHQTCLTSQVPIFVLISNDRSVWRPLKGPSDDWPLAVCDYTSIDKENDIILLDAIRRDRVDEICGLHYNESHRWHYLKNQGVNDLLVFRNADSEGERASKSQLILLISQCKA